MLLLVCVVLVFCTSVSAIAGTVSVTITSNSSSADSTTLGCTDLIDFYGINDDGSSRSLYCELYNDGSLFDTQFFSIALVPGVGEMTPVSWYRILYQYDIGGARLLYVHLDPDGANKTGCYGAGKLID